MSTAMLNIFIRTVKRRVEAGENLEDILEGYTKLTEEEKDAIRRGVEGE